MNAASDPSASRERALPFRFGPSQLLFDRIGTGGMAEIYLARETTRIGAARLAVVKIVRPALAADGRFAAMLVHEAKLAARLSHGNIVQTYDLGRQDGQLYIAMEYVEGYDLRQLLAGCARTGVALPAAYGLFIAVEVLRALDYAHRCADEDGTPLGIVHRDVSPSNVLVSFEGEVKLCDFGIARAAGERGEALPDELAGKAGYMSPEQAAGHEVGPRSDVFAAGVILWELLAGRRLYKGIGTAPDPLAVAREARVEPLPDHGLPRHEWLSAIVARALAREPALRHPTARAFARELDDYVADVGLHASPLRLGGFVTEHFGDELVARRRARERAAAALERGPLLSMEVLAPARRASWFRRFFDRGTER